MPPKIENDERNLTIFFAEWCGTCKKVVPFLSEKAEEAGFTTYLIDVEDPENRDLSSHVRWVPYIEYDGSEISIREFLRIIGDADEEE